MNGERTIQRRVWRNAAFGLAALLVLAGVVFGIAALLHASDPAVEELRAVIAVHAPPPRETPAPDLPTEQPAVVSATAWEGVGADWGSEAEKEAWWEEWSRLNSINPGERSAEDWQHLAAMLAERQAWMQDVREAVESADVAHPQLSPFWYMDGDPKGTLDILGELMHLSKLRQGEFDLLHRNGNYSAALDVLLDTWELWKKAPDGSTRQMMLSHTAGWFERSEMMSDPLTRDGVSKVVSKLGEVDFAQERARNLAVEASLLLDHFQKSRKAASGVEGLFYTTFMLRPDEAAYSRHMSRLVQATAAPYYVAREDFEALEQAVANESSWRTISTSMFVFPLIMEASFAAQHQARIDLTRIGLLVELHHAEHGVYPDSLSVLAPDLGGHVPVDPFTGQRYRYVPAEDGFLLYSLGENMQDNGGRHDRRDGDLVWRGDTRR